jgi:threonine dehydrogenase-like Zn-dependent dehydrogenase
MLAGVYTGIGNVEFREVPKPVTGKDDVLVRVRAAAICGTDLRIFKSGHFAIKRGEVRILGHEFAGEIVEVGSNVKTYREGMRVGVAPNVGCGVCRYCRMGAVHLCPDYLAFGVSLDGGFSEYFKISGKPLLQGNMVTFDSNTSFEEIALAEPLACCFNALESVQTSPGETVLIVGAGPMGVLHLQLNRLAGATLVMIADVLEERLKLISRFSPDITINTEEEDLREAVLRHTGGMGADVIITACPAPDIQRQSVQMAAKLGRINLFGGLPKGKEHVGLNTNLIHYNGIIVTGTTGASLSLYEHSIELIEGGKIETKSIVSKKFNISEIREAFDYALSGKGLKTLFVFQS